MPINPNRLEKLQEYGLTEYEARTYLALLDLGAATARDVANLSRVPRTKIYAVLDELHAKQLAQVIPERPKRYECVPFDVYLDSFERTYERKLKQIQEDKRLLASELRRSSLPAPDQKAGSFHVIKGRKNIVNKKYEMLARAQGSVLEMGSEYLAVRMAYFLPALREKAAEGVRLELLVPVVPVSADAVAEFRKVGVVKHSATQNLGSATLVVDDKEVLMCHYVPDDEHLFKGDDVAIWSDDRAIVADMKATVQAVWDGAEPADAALAGVVPALPGTPSPGALAEVGL